MSITLPELPDIKDAGILESFVHWGNPYHGPIVGNTLTLADATTLTVPATANNACFYFKVPTAPGALDENGDPVPAPVPGGEWRDYMLLYGNCDAIYCKDVSTSAVNWLYSHPDGSRWLIKLTSSSSGIATGSASLGLNWSAVRFGEMGGEPETINFTLTLADRGLDTTAIDPHITVSPSITLSIGISDIASDGSKCCLMFYLDGSGGESGNQRFPYAFFEVAINSTAFASSSVAIIYDMEAVGGVRNESLYSYAMDALPPLPYCDDVPYHTYSSGYGFKVVDNIIACWYDTAGEIQPIMFNYDEPFFPATAQVVGGSTSTCGDYSVAETNHAEYSINYGSPWFGIYTLNMVTDHVKEGVYHRPGTSSVSENFTFSFYNADATLFEMTYYIASGSTSNIVGEVNRRFTDWVSGALPDTSIYACLVVATSGMHAWSLAYTPVRAYNDLADFIPEANNAPQIFAKRFSPTLIGFGRTWINRTSLQRETRIDKFLTKAGMVSNSYSVPLDITLAEISATIHPVTLELSIGSDSAYRSFV